VAASLGDPAEHQAARYVGGFSHRYQCFANPADALAGAGEPVGGQVLQALHGRRRPP
jgi:hypothetical protein